MTVHTVRSLAEIVGGTLLGAGADTVITGVNEIRSATPEQVSFLGNAKYEQLAHATRAGALLVSPRDADKFTCTRIVVESPSGAFARITPLFAPPPIQDEPGVHPTAVVAADAVLGRDVSIQAHAVIEKGVRIGDRTVIGANSFVGQETVIGPDARLHPLVTLRERCVLGARVIIHSGAVIGSDGFGYELQKDRYVKIPHTGFVQIDDDAEIGANTTIDRARFGKTHIGEGAKIDNLVQIGHNVIVGAHSIIVSQSGIAGSTTLGRYVTLAAQVGIAGHLTLGDRSTLTAQSGINKDMAPGVTLSGRHAIAPRDALRLEAMVRRLPLLLDRVKELEDKVRSLS